MILLFLPRLRCRQIKFAEICNVREPLVDRFSLHYSRLAFWPSGNMNVAPQINLAILAVSFDVWNNILVLWKGLSLNLFQLGMGSFLRLQPVALKFGSPGFV